MCTYLWYPFAIVVNLKLCKYAEYAGRSLGRDDSFWWAVLSTIVIPYNKTVDYEYKISMMNSRTHATIAYTDTVSMARRE